MVVKDILKLSADIACWNNIYPYLCRRVRKEENRDEDKEMELFKVPPAGFFLDTTESGLVGWERTRWLRVRLTTLPQLSKDGGLS